MRQDEHVDVFEAPVVLLGTDHQRFPLLLPLVVLELKALQPVARGHLHLPALPEHYPAHPQHRVVQRPAQHVCTIVEAGEGERERVEEAVSVGVRFERVQPRQRRAVRPPVDEPAFLQRGLHGPVQHRILRRPALPARQAKGAPAVVASEKRGPVLLGAERLLARRAQVVRQRRARAGKRPPVRRAVSVRACMRCLLRGMGWCDVVHVYAGVAHICKHTRTAAHGRESRLARGFREFAGQRARGINGSCGARSAPPPPPRLPPPRRDCSAANAWQRPRPHRGRRSGVIPPRRRAPADSLARRSAGPCPRRRCGNTAYPAAPGGAGRPTLSRHRRTTGGSSITLGK